MGASLVTRAEYKAYGGVVNPIQDDLIDSLIVSVSSLVKMVCRRTFVDYVVTPKVEYTDAGTASISLEEYPIIGTPTLEYSSDYGNTYTPLAHFTDFATQRALGVLRSLSSTGFTEQINGYRITYTAGYTEVPEDLKLAVFDLITYYIKKDFAVHSNRAPGANSVQIEYITTTDLPAHIKRVLDLYTSNYN